MSSAQADLSGAYNEFWWERGSTLTTINGKKRTSLIVDPANGRIPPPTPAAEQRATARAAYRVNHPADGPEDRSLAERCLLSNAGPPMLPRPYNNYVQIFQFSDYVIILNEMIHDARIIQLDGRPSMPSSNRKWLGDSHGHWEGNTLIIDTMNFTDKTNFRGADENLHLVERCTRTAADTLLTSSRLTTQRRHEAMVSSIVDDEDSRSHF